MKHSGPVLRPSQQQDNEKVEDSSLLWLLLLFGIQDRLEHYLKTGPSVCNGLGNYSLCFLTL